ncbi:hypothetical protein H6761_03765 [Candidatus Nomurabacteria bacterium]|nr:hypothetical protein [Candidatus Nomurabacteria bacterium]
MKKFISLAFSFSLLFVPFISHAGFLDDLSCIPSGNCGLLDVEFGFVLLTKFLIGSVGALALLYFIWGGIQWLTSYGNLEKVRHGREIMLQTIVAIVIAFLSFILVEFFINDVLQARQPVISTGCAGKTMGASCGEDKLHVCTGQKFTGEDSIHNERCVTKCELKNLQDKANVWTCLAPEIASQAGVEKELNLCPGTEICVNANTIPLRNIPVTEFNDQNRCCVGAPTNSGSACRSIGILDTCLPGTILSENTCSSLAMCDSNWHTDPGCCIEVDPDSSFTCQQQTPGTICEFNFSANLLCSSVPGC